LNVSNGYASNGSINGDCECASWNHSLEREREREREGGRIRYDTQRLARRVIARARIEEQDSGFQITPPTSSEELRKRF